MNMIQQMVGDTNPEVDSMVGNINVSFEFIFQMIEDSQDLAKFSNSQKVSLNNKNFSI